MRIRLIVLTALLAAPGAPAETNAPPAAPAEDALAAADYAGGELDISLAGEWMGQVGPGTAVPRAAAGDPVVLPAFVRAAGTNGPPRVEAYRSAYEPCETPHAGIWLARRVFIPSGWAGAARMELRFGAVSARALVAVDGEILATHVGGYDPFTVDVTVALAPGQTHLIAVHCSRSVAPLQNLRGDRLDARLGIWQDVTLAALPAQRIADLFVAPRLSRERVEAQVTVESDSPAAVRVSAAVHDGADPLVRTSGRMAELVPGAPATVDLELKGGELEPWWPQRPKLYELRVEIRSRDGRTLHERRVRFGYREFEVRGPDLYLNGVQTRLRESSQLGVLASDSPFRTPESIREGFRRMKSWGVNATRVHQGPGWPAVFDIADEEGLLAIEEFSNTDWLVPPEGNRAARDCVAGQLERLVRRDRNHPSIVLWSLANESWRQCDRVTDWKGQCYRHYLDRLRGVDPTRTFFFGGASKGWPETVAGHFACASMAGDNGLVDSHYPASCRALTRIMNLDGAAGRYDRPLSSGVILYYAYPEQLGPGDRLVGEPFAPARDVWERVGWAQHTITDAWRTQGVARYGVLSAPTLFGNTESGAGVYQPVRVSFAMDLPGNYWHDEAVTKRLTVINDSLAPLACRPVLEGPFGTIRGDAIRVDPAGTRTVGVRLPPLRKVRSAAPIDLTARILDENGQPLADDRQVLTIYPAWLRTAGEGGAPVDVYDPAGGLLDALKALGVACRRAKQLDELWASDAGALAAYVPDASDLSAEFPALTAALARGARILLLAPGLGYEMDSCFARVSSPGHPAFDDLPATGVIGLWRNPDGILYDHFLPIPTRGRARMLLEHRAVPPADVWWWRSDREKAAACLDGTVLVELRHGPGRIILSTLRLVESFEDPYARLLLRNVVRCLGSAPASAAKVGYIGRADLDLRRGPDALLAPEGVVDSLPAEEEAPTVAAGEEAAAGEVKAPMLFPGGCDLLVVGTGAVADTPRNILARLGGQLREFVERGGTVLALPQDPRTWTPRWLPEPVDLVALDAPAEAGATLDAPDPALWGVRSTIDPRWKLDGLTEPACTAMFRLPEDSPWRGLVRPIGKLAPPFAPLDGFSLVSLRLGEGRYILCQLDPRRAPGIYGMTMAPLLMNLGVGTAHPDHLRQLGDYLAGH